MTDRVRAGGLRTVLLATVVAGGIGYLIQAFVPPLLSTSGYLTFTTFWSATYLIVSCLSGVQQELTRASRFAPVGDGYRTWRLFTGMAAVAAAVVVALIFAVLGNRVFPNDTVPLIIAVTVAAFGYCVVAGVSGALYGVQDWPGVGGMMITDSVVRAIALAVAVAIGGGAVMMGSAVAVPFIIAAVIVWIWRGRLVRAHLHLDIGLPGLARNASATLLASLATGMLISGLPLLLRSLVPDAGEAILASLILVISLTRAPLVVPLVALQGYLLLQFRESRRHAAAVLRWVGALLVLVAALAALAWWLGPVILGWLYPTFHSLSGGVFAAIVASAGLTGVLCVTGPALLAASRHRWYVAGWLLSAIVTVAVLLIPWDALSRILAALVVAPVAGAVLHAIGLARTRAGVTISATD